jgi:predicted membrane-bound spermidine synthase
VRRYGRVELVVFAAGVATLGAEIAAQRLVAPVFGASTVVWANTIAVVLVALSGGYWLGGRLADRRPHVRDLSLTALAGAALVALVPLVAVPVLGGTEDVGSLLALVVLVAPPVLVLGAVSPWAIRLRVTGIKDAGDAAGRVYALSTAGGLVGTFASALALIPLVGTRWTFLLCAALLALAAIPGACSSRPA